MVRQRFRDKVDCFGETTRQILNGLEGVDPQSAAVCLQVMDAMQLFGKYHAQLLNRTGLPASQAGCLMLIGVFEGESQRELAKKLGVASSSATVMLQRMEKAGLIERKPDKTDQRILRVFLNEHGRQSLQDVKRAFADFINHTIGGISERGREAIQIVMDELAASIQKARAGQ